MRGWLRFFLSHLLPCSLPANSGKHVFCTLEKPQQVSTGQASRSALQQGKRRKCGPIGAKTAESASALCLVLHQASCGRTKTQCQDAKSPADLTIALPRRPRDKCRYHSLPQLHSPIPSPENQTLRHESIKRAGGRRQEDDRAESTGKGHARFHGPPVSQPGHQH